MSDIVLSSGVRSNLLALQRTQNLAELTQTRLATGRRVNSALDDPTNFFTSSGLNNRSSDLSRLLDFISNSVQTVESADNGISSITKLVESAESSARQALQSAASRGTTTGNVALAATDDLVSGTPGLTLGDTLTIGAGTNSLVLTVAADNTGDNVQTVDDIVNAINETDFARARLTTEGFLDIETIEGSDLQLALGATTDTLANLGIQTTGATSYTNELALTGATALNTLVSAADILTISDGTNTKAITVGADGTASDNAAGTVQGLIDEINSTTFATATLDGTELVITTADGSTPLSLAFTDAGSAGDTINDLGFASNQTFAAVENTDRSALAAEFDVLRGQISDLANDAGFSGVNLLQGDDLRVFFNENDTSFIDIQGVNFDADGLGIAASTAQFQSNSSISSALDNLDAAISQLRRQAATFGSNLSVVEVREDFITRTINTLQVGADNLVLADINQEGANLLALQTRQQLSSTALSLASQADQAVLSLF